MKALVFIICLGLIFLGCKKNQTGPQTASQTGYSQNQGVLVGYNMRMCAEPSCGGMIITIKNDASKNPSPSYLFNGTLPNLAINDSTKFPINVILSWKRDTGVYGSYNYILISQIKVIN